MLVRAHRFATGLPCRASCLAGIAMLASLRVAAGMGCGSRPSGRASLAREKAPEILDASFLGSSLAGTAASSAQSQTRATATDLAALSPNPPSGKRRATGAHRMPEAARGVAVAAM